MIVTGYLILEPGADRPYFSHTYPTGYQKKPGAQVYQFDVPLPDFEHVDGKILAVVRAELSTPP